MPRANQPRSRANVTAKQERFAQAILAGENQSQAYRTGYGAEGYGENALAVKASRLMDLPHVAARVAQLQHATAAEVAQELAITPMRVIRELLRTADDARACEQHAVTRRAWRDIGETLHMWDAPAPVVHNHIELATGELRALLGLPTGQVIDGDSRPA